MQYVVFWKFLSLRQTNIREEVQGRASKCQTGLTPEETRGTTLNPFTIVFVRAAGKVDRGAGAANTLLTGSTSRAATPAPCTF